MVQPVLPDPTAKAARKGGGVLLGCGGAGCGVALLLAVAGAVLLVFGLDPKTEEALPFGVIVLGLAFLGGLVGFVLLVLGIIKRRG